MRGMTHVKKQLMWSVISAPKHTISSLYRLALELGLDYHYAWQAAHELAACQYLIISRAGGHQLTLTIPSQQRGATMTDELQKYQRPAIPLEEEREYVKFALRINALKDTRMRLITIQALLVENARLAREINEHRTARGFEPLETHDPSRGV